MLLNPGTCAVLVAVLAAPVLAAPAPERTKVAVLDVRAVGVDPAKVEPLSALVASEVARREDLSVVAGTDLRALVGFEKQREALGCNDASCLADVGGALGVRYLVATEVAVFAGAWLLTFSLVDVPRAAPVRRLTRQAASETDVLSAAADGVAELVRALPRAEATDVPSGTARALTRGALGAGWLAAAIGGAIYGVAWTHDGERMLRPDAEALRTKAGVGLGLLAGGAVVGTAAAVLLMRAL